MARRRRNPDERTRQAERAWTESGDPYAAVAWLQGLARQRELHADPAGVIPALEVLVRTQFEGLPFDPVVELIVARARAGKTMQIDWEGFIAEADVTAPEARELVDRQVVLASHPGTKRFHFHPFPGVEAVRWAEALSRPLYFRSQPSYSSNVYLDSRHLRAAKILGVPSTVPSDDPARPRLHQACLAALKVLGVPVIPLQAVAVFPLEEWRSHVPDAIDRRAAQDGWAIYWSGAQLPWTSALMVTDYTDVLPADDEAPDEAFREYALAHGLPAVPEIYARLQQTVGTDQVLAWSVKASAFWGQPHALHALLHQKVWSPESYRSILQGWWSLMEPDIYGAHHPDRSPPDEIFEEHMGGDVRHVDVVHWRTAELDLVRALLGGRPLA